MTNGFCISSNKKAVPTQERKSAGRSKVDANSIVSNKIELAKGFRMRAVVKKIWANLAFVFESTIACANRLLNLIIVDFGHLIFVFLIAFFLGLCNSGFRERIHPEWGQDQVLSYLILILGGAVTIFQWRRSVLSDFMPVMRNFNERYDKLNGVLNSISQITPTHLTEDAKAALDDYFNLCAEQWLYRELHYVPSSVWASWWKGMNLHFCKHVVRKKWNSEDVGTYYGFRPPHSNFYDGRFRLEVASQSERTKA